MAKTLTIEEVRQKLLELWLKVAEEFSEREKALCQKYGVTLGDIDDDGYYFTTKNGTFKADYSGDCLSEGAEGEDDRNLKNESRFIHEYYELCQYPTSTTSKFMESQGWDEIDVDWQSQFRVWRKDGIEIFEPFYASTLEEITVK